MCLGQERFHKSKIRINKKHEFPNKYKSTHFDLLQKFGNPFGVRLCKSKIVEIVDFSTDYFCRIGLTILKLK